MQPTNLLCLIWLYFFLNIFSNIIIYIDYKTQLSEERKEHYVVLRGFMPHSFSLPLVMLLGSFPRHIWLIWLLISVSLRQVTESDAVDVVETALKRHTSDMTTRAMSLVALLKLSYRFPSCSKCVGYFLAPCSGVFWLCPPSLLFWNVLWEKSFLQIWVRFLPSPASSYQAIVIVGRG